MRSNWLIAVACSVSLATPFAHAQAHSTAQASQQATAHRTMSPIGKAMAELLRQAASQPSPATSSAVPVNGPAARAVADDASTDPAATATSARPAAEVAVQPPL